MASPHPQRRESLFAPAEGGRYSTDNIDGQRLDKDGMDSGLLHFSIYPTIFYTKIDFFSDKKDNK
jgi:hypothetical protein